MCFNQPASLMLAAIGAIATFATANDKKENSKVRAVRSIAILWFTLMELLQYFAYPVVNQCGYGTNLFLSKLASYHILLQSLAFMPAAASYSSDKNAINKAFVLGILVSVFNFSNYFFDFGDIVSTTPDFFGRIIECIYMGKYHIAYSIPVSNGFVIMWLCGFGLAQFGFLWKNNWKIATFHTIMQLISLFIPEWLLGVSAGEGGAIYCFFSIPICIGYMPIFKNFFKGNE